MKPMVAMVMAALLLPIAAAAQEWKAYDYPEPGFSVEFPGVPAVETAIVKDAFGESLPVTRYTVRLDQTVCTLSVANYANTNEDALNTIAGAERSLRASGQVTAATAVRVSGNRGRALRVTGADGSRSAVAIFFVDRHLYTVVGQSLAPQAEASADAIRFVESLRFTEDTRGTFSIFSFFGGGDADRPKVARAAPAEAPPAERPRAIVPPTEAPRATTAPAAVVHGPYADAACAGRSAGDVVQLDTPAGPVAATCTLVARPNAAPASH
ncbi:MAG TPA: hypothetical protein VMC02_07895 [Steroidobacteraceae bacterium]|nr:hypothetical protein [Steroidobacteraceae bacterium]